ncbi:hypothetical protein WN55_10195 [Dufourea novaeangliae]|uniref:Uncharacterized protein n=1 Tax=Dufourea novaeangliae TaxID=178035 RepID=A0A154P2Y4_DUFNO|nr:hypothetical protein WN55_10195 [Dufourea novaeangliae]
MEKDRIIRVAPLIERGYNGKDEDEKCYLPIDCPVNIIRSVDQAYSSKCGVSAALGIQSVVQKKEERPLRRIAARNGRRLDNAILWVQSIRCD